VSITGITSQFTRITYGVYAWIVLTGCVIPILVLLIFTPARRGRRQVARWGGKIFFSLIGSPVRLEGADQLPRSPCIVVANHASYLDGMILTAALPPNFTFLIKHEMARLPLAGFLLKRIGSEFVDREKSSHRNRAARRLLKAAARGDSLAFFPEGTFDATPGLRPFQLGAFSSASWTKLPVVPIVILGSRAKLPSASWFCSPGSLSVRICPSIDPMAHDSALALVQATRGAMLEWLGEPDLAPLEEEPVAERLRSGPLQPDGSP